MTRVGPRQRYTVAVSGAFFFAAVAPIEPARADTVAVHCKRMSPLEQAELQARARLLLSSAGWSQVTVDVDCDARDAWLLWQDGTRATLATTTSLVEAALDAIEARVAGEQVAGRADGASPALPTTGSTSAQGDASRPAGVRAVDPAARATPRAGDQAAMARPAARPEAASTQFEARPVRQRGAIDGGVSLATVTEFWSGAIGVGPRLDIGIGIKGPWAGVVAEGARFATGGRGATAMVFDLQAGIAFGAPYARRTGIGAVALVGAERLASGGNGGMWMWSLTGALGVRASMACGPVDVWLGADVLVRSQELKGHDDHIPPVAAQLTLGVLVPAWSSNLLARAGDEHGASTGL